ncbi:MAG: glycosyl transferase family 1 [Deltaproteobacteria bacterium]|nr:glycosyl transferase family 1 [Deltaproteobacteria bacterium]
MPDWARNVQASAFMPARPIRVKIKNELGLPTSLPSGEQYHRLTGTGPDVVVWGLGPDSAACVRLCPEAPRVFWIEAPDFEVQMPPSWHAAIPSHWIRVDPRRAPSLSRTCQTLIYEPNFRLFPSFWHPLAAHLRAMPGGMSIPAIWLPAPANALVVPELAKAAQNLGLAPRRLPASLAVADLTKRLEQETPTLFVSVNFHGLDPYGENQALLEAAGVPVVVWCVDNPFHLLSSQKNHLWKKLPLAVTDEWFVPPLRQLGARPVHLPLATDPDLFAPGPVCPNGRDLLFVGRSRFPDRDAFFAASSVSDTLLLAAKSLPGRQAHFGWWHDKRGGQPWPGADVRNTGLGAELASERWRIEILRALSHTETLTIVGDAAWTKLVPAARHLPPVDYYAGLAQTHARASFCLNLTSLLLPHGLTQRHFDVWASGGFLLTDTTPGLAIFPPELVAAVSFEDPGRVHDLIRDFATNPDRKNELRRAWQAHILAEHVYTRRLERILSFARNGL